MAVKARKGSDGTGGERHGCNGAYRRGLEVTGMDWAGQAVDEGKGVGLNGL